MSRTVTHSAGYFKSAVSEDSRPREIMLRQGCQALSDEQLLAILLRTGSTALNVLDLARLILSHYGSLRELAKASPEELMANRFPGLGEVKCIELSATLEVTRRVLAWRDPDTVFSDPDAVARYIAPDVECLDHEQFFVFPLNRKNRLIGRPRTVSIGTVDASLAHPREVFRECVRVSASAVIVAHNHPSGDPAPSHEDIAITRRLIEAGSLLRIPLLDHIVVGRPAETSFFSFARSDLVEFPVR